MLLVALKSKVKRAATSAIRVAPLVITKACTAIKMMNTVKPITRPCVPDPPTTKELNARIIYPLNRSPNVKINRVEDTFSPSPKTVEVNKSEGNTEKSVGFSTNNTISNIKRLKIRLKAINASRICVGRGTTIEKTTTNTEIATKASVVKKALLPCAIVWVTSYAVHVF